MNNNLINYMILVNKNNNIPSNWMKLIKLVDITNSLGETFKVEQKTAIAYQKLRDELLNESITIELDGGYRSLEEQTNIYKKFEKEKGVEYAKKYVAIPGTSEHHTGLAIDIKIIKDGKVMDDNDQMNLEKEIFEKIHTKLYKYGFILRYPKDKKIVTGYNLEVWHFRYIDNIDIAKYIMDNNLTLEEYLNR